MRDVFCIKCGMENGSIVEFLSHLFVSVRALEQLRWLAQTFVRSNDAYITDLSISIALYGEAS